jgi:hypothetical protein
MNQETSPPHMNGASHAKNAGDAVDWAAPELYVRKLVRRAEGELRQHPIRSLGLAMGLGVGVGTLLASRIARMLLVTAGSYAAKEFLRGRIKTFLAEAVKAA